MRRLTLRFQLFIAMVGVALLTTLAVGFFARSSLSRAFDDFLSGMPMPSGTGRGRGRMMLSAAERTFLARVDQGVIIAAAIGFIIAMVVALVLAAYLVRPLRRLEVAANQLATGDLSHRVDADGSLEVAALGEAFNTMADSLEEAESLRRRLVADVAHELRNPLAAARAQAEGIVDQVIEPDPARLESLLDDLRHLSALIDDLQELAVAEAGRLTYEMSTVDLASLATAEADRASGLFSSGVDLVVDVVDEAVEVEGDERRLAQVLKNLLTNAARYTDSGNVTVSVAKENGEAVVSVSDTGDGIPQEDLGHIFERFYRVDGSRTASTGGTGLGLAISRSIVRDHHGEMFAESQPGEGSRIGFRLPLRQPV